MREKVLTTDLHGKVKEIHASKAVYHGHAVITANSSMGRTQTVPGEERLLERGVSYCATCDGAFFRNQEMAVAGNNDEAVEKTLLLAKLALRAHLLVRTPEPKASPDLAAEVNKHGKVETHLATGLREIVTGNGSKPCGWYYRVERSG